MFFLKNNNGWFVAGSGVIVSGLGRYIGGSLGAGITGFGMAQVMLGMLNMLRPTAREG